ncbi:MAG: heme ABC exporter ATP-binding protein CcmA, partial [Pseudomonadota bacterium]
MAWYPFALGVELLDVGVARGGRPVVAGASMRANPGEAVQLFGANGSGKSSLLQAIAGLTPLAAGRLVWRVDAGAPQPHAPAGALVYVGHDAPVKPALTARENLRYWAAWYAKAPRDVAEVIDRMGLAAIADAPVVRFSAGQRRRLDLARCLLARRPFWLMDEPTGAGEPARAALWGREGWRE